MNELLLIMAPAAVVMNVIAWDSAYCLYPRATLETHETLFVRHDLPNTQEFMGKYQRRGYRIHRQMRSPRRWALYAGSVIRWIGDGRAWTIRLPPGPESEGAPVPTMTRDPCIGTAWQLEGHTPIVSFDTISSPWLRHTYIGRYGHHDMRSVIKQIERQAEEGEEDEGGEIDQDQDEDMEDSDDEL